MNTEKHIPEGTEIKEGINILIHFKNGRDPVSMVVPEIASNSEIVKHINQIYHSEEWLSFTTDYLPVAQRQKHFSQVENDSAFAKAEKKYINPRLKRLETYMFLTQIVIFIIGVALVLLLIHLIRTLWI